MQVIEVNPRNHKIKIQNGKEIGYDKLLLATGLDNSYDITGFPAISLAEALFKVPAFRWGDTYRD